MNECYVSIYNSPCLRVTFYFYPVYTFIVLIYFYTQALVTYLFSFIQLLFDTILNCFL